MKGMLALDVIGKWVIVLVVIAVVIELFLTFSGQFSNPFEEYFKTKEDLGFPKIVKQSEFSAGEISTYIESCYDTMTNLPDNEQKDIECYILDADNTFNLFVTEEDILNDLKPDIRDKVEIKTNFDKNLIIIRFKDVGDKIIITS